MTNTDILEIAMKQSAIDANCSPEDFKRTESIIVESVKNQQARQYLDLPLPCNLISYGTNIVASIDLQYRAILEQPDFRDLYIPQFSNALCETRKELDVLGVGAYKEDQLVGLAACSADCDSMWQIGIDVLPEERRKGIASALTRRLAIEILHRGKVPFYCCVWSNIRSARTAIKSGFRPAWVEMTVKPKEFVDKMNRIDC